MDNRVKQALAEFETFLAGASAPALVGHSLATVVRQDVRLIASTVVRWSYDQPGPDAHKVLLAARAKVFDIFFYRVVRFSRIHQFFPAFETALIEALPENERAAVQALFDANPWRDIRPLGALRDPQEFALEVRKDATVSPERFNEDLYKNATHQILSADRRFTFDSDEQRTNVAACQARVTEVFDDFVSLISDAILKREILLANTADKDVVYTARPRFQAEHYVCQLADLGIALTNDGYLAHGLQIFSIATSLAASSGVDLLKLQRFQEKAALINRARITEYVGTFTASLLLRRLLPLFGTWSVDALVVKAATDAEAAERRFALTLLRAYGREAYRAVVDTVERTQEPESARQFVSLLAQIKTDQPSHRDRAVLIVARYLKPDGGRGPADQAIAALCHLGTPKAVEALVAALERTGPEFGRRPEATEFAHRLLVALLQIRTTAAVEAAYDFCAAHELLLQYRADFAAAPLSERIRAAIAQRVRREARKLKLSFSLFGDPSSTSSILSMLGTGAYPDVAQLCNEITSSFPTAHELAVEAARLAAAGPPPEQPFDRGFEALLAERNISEALSYAHESGLTGSLEIATRGGINCEVWMRKGEVVRASVPSLFGDDENAFYWIFSLEAGAIASVRFGQEVKASDGGSVLPTADLIREGLFRQGHVQQVIAGILSPESRFRRRLDTDLPTSVAEFATPAHAVVWERIAEPLGLDAIVSATRLSEHEAYKVLFDFVRHNLLVIEEQELDHEVRNIQDALAQLDLSIRRIEGHPAYFQAYQAASDTCAYLARESTNEAIQTAVVSLQTCFDEAFALRKMMTGQPLEACARTVRLVVRYLRSGSDADRNELLEYVDIYFPEGSRFKKPPEDESSFIKSLLEQIENIDVANDPFDMVAEKPAEQSRNDAFASLDEIVAVQTGGEGMPLQEAESASLLELFGEVAGGYVKPLKDFVREVDRDLKTGRPTTAAWLDLVAPSLELLLVAASKVGNEQVQAAIARLDRSVRHERRQGFEFLSESFCGYILTEYYNLAALLPETFALSLTDEKVEAKKERLLVKFVTRQIAEVDDRIYNKLILAGFSTFDDFMTTRPDEISHAAGIDRQLADRIFMKFYQYQDIYYHGAEAEKNAKFLAIFAISLGVLKEVDAAVARAVGARQTGDLALPEGALLDRQRALWSLFTLLCIKGELDLIEKLQQSVFEERVKGLDDYFKQIAGAPFPQTAILPPRAS